jgi:hypothetical protein
MGILALINWGGHIRESAQAIDVRAILCAAAPGRPRWQVRAYPASERGCPARGIALGDSAGS